MKRIYIVSKCLGRKGDIYEFHFIGYYNGMRIRKIEIRGEHFEKGVDYVVALSNIGKREDILYGDCVKYKKIF